MDLAGLTLLLGNIPKGYQATQADALALQQREREMAGEAAAGSSLTDFSGGYGQLSAGQTGMPFGPPGTTGPAPPPQQPQMPGMNAPGGAGGMAPQGAQPGAGAAPGGGGPIPQTGPSPFAGTAGAGGGQPQQGMMGGMSIQQLAATIKRRNPGIDPGTLFEAVKQANALLNPESKMLLQFMMNQQRIQEQERGQDIRAGTAQAGQETQRDIAGQRTEAQRDIATQRTETQKETTAERVGAQERGQDISSADRAAGRAASMDRTKLIQDRIDGRAAASTAGKAVVAANKAKYNELVKKRMTVSDEISAAMAEAAGVPDDNIKKLQAEKKALDDQLVAFWKKAQDGGVTLPRPSELVGLGGGAPAADTQGQGGAPQAGAPAGGGVPNGLPDPKGLAEGSIAKDSTGKAVAKILNGAWVPPEGQ